MVNREGLTQCHNKEAIHKDPILPSKDLIHHRLVSHIDYVEPLLMTVALQNSGYPGYGGGYQPPPPQGGFMPQDGGYGYPQNDVYNGAGDPEDPNKGFTFDDASIRRGFIRKVYSILMVSDDTLSVTNFN